MERTARFALIMPWIVASADDSGKEGSHRSGPDRDPKLSAWQWLARTLETLARRVPPTVAGSVLIAIVLIMAVVSILESRTIPIPSDPIFGIILMTVLFMLGIAAASSIVLHAFAKFRSGNRKDVTQKTLEEGQNKDEKRREAYPPNGGG